MEIAKAKFFVFHDLDTHTIYTSKSIDSIREKNRFFPISVWGVVDTVNGEKMIKVEEAYGEPVLYPGGLNGTFIHWESFKRAYANHPFIEI